MRPRGINVITCEVPCAEHYDVIVECEYSVPYWDRTEIDGLSDFIKERGITNIVMSATYIYPEDKEYALSKGIELVELGEFPKKQNTGLFQEIIKQNK